MKIYSIVITLLAVIGIGASGYLFWAQGEMRNEIANLTEKSDSLNKEKTEMIGKLDNINTQISKMQKTVELFNLLVNSFMYAGDLKISSIGSEEGTAVEEAIKNLENSQDRMGAENDWNDFKTTKGFNPLFGLLRNLANSLTSDIKNINPSSD